MQDSKDDEGNIQDLETLIHCKEEELIQLKVRLQQLKCTSRTTDQSGIGHNAGDQPRPLPVLSKVDIKRYGRQLILPQIGIKGQQKLLTTSVLVVGAGGLGCPVALYLAAAGIGCLGIVDHDRVELNNLHRQVLHTQHSIGHPKVDSAAWAITSLNSVVQCVPYSLLLTSSNIGDIITQYDIVIDATDNVATRYLLSDACVLWKKPLVSGSALGFEGQLTVYNYSGGPCYRCLYPTPPPPEAVTNCSDAGVLGCVPGIIGCLQAMEVIKVAVGLGASYSQKMLLFDGTDGTFRTITLRPRQKDCVVCGENPSITRLVDYVQFCGAAPTDKDENLHLLADEDRITAQEYQSVLDRGMCHLLIDTRNPHELDICSLPNCLNIPFQKLNDDTELDRVREKLNKLNTIGSKQVFVVCRQGNDSQKATLLLRNKLADLDVTTRDIRGGLWAWAEANSDFPIY